MIVWLLAGSALAQVDVNTATLQELDALPGIGAAKAEAIVQWRALHGPCTDPAELGEVPGLGAATLAALSGRVRCGRVDDIEREPDPPLEATAPVALPGAVNVNRATAEQLLALPGMVRARAEAIVADRDRNGPFASCAELVRVAGIGPATVANLGPKCATE